MRCHSLQSTGWALHAAMLGWLWREAASFDQWNVYLMLRWAAYLALVAFVSHRIGDRITLIFTGVPFVAVGFLLAQRILGGHEGELAIWNVKTLVDVAVLGLALATSFVAQPREARIAFRLAIHAGSAGAALARAFLPGSRVHQPAIQLHRRPLRLRDAGRGALPGGPTPPGVAHKG